MHGNESVNDYIKKMQDLFNQMRLLGEDILERRTLEKILRSVVPKFEMFTTNILVPKDLNTTRIDELSGSMLIVEENPTNEQMEHGFSTRYRGRGRSRG